MMKGCGPIYADVTFNTLAVLEVGKCCNAGLNRALQLNLSHGFYLRSYELSRE
jgi:hypothetical protein